VSVANRLNFRPLSPTKISKVGTSKGKNVLVCSKASKTLLAGSLKLRCEGRMRQKFTRSTAYLSFPYPICSIAGNLLPGVGSREHDMAYMTSDTATANYI
jgi:hypothetical protein